MNGQWDHDLYQNSRRSSSAGGSSNGPAKLVISNLDFGVNDQDIRVKILKFRKKNKKCNISKSGPKITNLSI